jgi:hypothetical protein
MRHLLLALRSRPQDRARSAVLGGFTANVWVAPTAVIALGVGQEFLLTWFEEITVQQSK